MASNRDPSRRSSARTIVDRGARQLDDNTSPPLQLGNLRFQLLDPLSLPHHQGRQLLIGRTSAGRHPAMIDKTRRRSSSHAAHLISYWSTRSATTASVSTSWGRT